MSAGATSDRAPAGLALLLPFVLVSFAANSLITRHVVGQDLLDAGLLTGVRFLAGAVALLLLAGVRRERLRTGRDTLLPALWLGLYAVFISYGYVHIGAAAGTFVFYAAVLLTLVAVDRRSGGRLPGRRIAGAAVALVGIGVLASDSVDTVSLLGVVLLAATGVAWGLYTAAGRGRADPRQTTTANFAVLALVCLVPTAAGMAAGLQVTVPGLLWGTAMGAGTTAFAYVAWYACQRRLTGAQAGLVQLVIPVLTTAGAVLLLGEPLTVRLLVAAVLVGLGMWLGRAVPARTPAPSAAR
ncbi:MAG: Permease of the drug/metabolite transporter (DMT) superfamily [uncultured Frankineae bacterium]|uniref:Permease of the drug/metabolite transporter (DMT) superfamily n=1 Tax=uncultured Frankineae bacterium TaxID=437475 RepID=A0A6J4MH67_9ACTN|nr:MAG: Permease of the drug/metabolite transporter (DMT) superfamily [uncultured Frankineae bacterium]